MKWISPEVKGDLPAPRNSHTAMAIENKLIIYGGDCGDRYHGEVDVLDTDALTWSRLAIQGSSPGLRAGHAAVNVGTKVENELPHKIERLVRCEAFAYQKLLMKRVEDNLGSLRFSKLL